MKKQLTIIAFFAFFAFFSCEKSELDLNDELNQRVPDQLESCETAFALGDRCFLEDGFNRWGWVLGPFSNEDKTVHEIWAAAGQCVLENGTLVGHLYVDYLDGEVKVTYDAIPGEYLFTEIHLYIGNEMYPVNRRGRETVAPGQYPYGGVSEPSQSITYVLDDFRDEIYIIAHAVVCPDDKKDDDDMEEEVPT